MEATPSSQRKTRQRKPYKTSDLLKRAKNCGRRVFTISEDKIIIKCVSSSKFDNDWESVANLLSSRSARQCRDRWTYYLSPANNLSPFSPEEDQLIIEKVNEIGKKWSQISKYFTGRSDNSIKNRWYSKLVSRCEIDETGNYSLKPDKLNETSTNKQNSHKQTQDTTIQLDKSEVSEPETINEQDPTINDYFSLFPLKITKPQEYDQPKTFYDFWDGEFMEWPTEPSNGNTTHTELEFF